MSTDHRQATNHLERLLQSRSPDEVAQLLGPCTDNPAPKVSGGLHSSAKSVERHWALLNATAETRAALLDPQSLDLMEEYRRKVENFIGTVKVPIGLAGPLRVNGLFAHGDYYLPLATTEAALVASYSRGAQLISEAGGCSAVLLSEGIGRAPGFAFRNLQECGLFIVWATSHLDEFRRAAAETTHHGQLTDMRITVEGNHVYLIFEFRTGDASGAEHGDHRQRRRLYLHRRPQPGPAAVFLR
jgi:hydroxymethylglutaryl-CoA reductase (NADPH)